MATTIKLPKLGDCSEAMVTAILVKVGDFVKKDTVICEVESEKVNFEIRAEADGRILELPIQLNEPIFVGDTVALIGEKP